MAARNHAAAVREAQRSVREQERLAAAAMRASASERAAAERDAKLAYIAAREAETDQRNAELAETFDEIANLLDATLDVDDWVDLESLRKPADTGSFDRVELLVVSPPPRYYPLPARPVFIPPAAPSGLGGVIGGSRRYAAQVDAAHREYRNVTQQWERAFVGVCQANAELRASWRNQEAERLTELRAARRRFEEDALARRGEVDESNERLDQLIVGLRERRGGSIDEYLGIVLANSIYPDSFEVSYEHSFNAPDRELAVSVLVPHPERFPSVKEYRYSKANDEIIAVSLPVAETKRRYASAIAQTALRTVHEVLEADREEMVDSVSLTVAVDTVDSATGHDTRVDLIRLATDRTDFSKIDLARVEAAATLAHLAAAVSKNPYALIPLASQGVRG
ncbi:hypothetical protein ACIO14_31595 [Nocardia fluminea]|uniref:hypothetical protein n=1 Tax=Nocardia fluminea TaxID=134984 RepID=UPI0037F22A59